MEKKQNSLNVNPFHFKDVPQYLTMRDGVKIAIELVLPKNFTSKDKLIPNIFFFL